MTLLTPGDPVGHFTLPTGQNPRFQFDTAAGRYLVLCFHGSARADSLRAVLEGLRAADDVFNDAFAACFAVSIDAADRARVAERVPGFRVFLDEGALISQRFGVCALDRDAMQGRLQPATFVLDPMLRVLATFPIGDPADHARRVIDYVRMLPRSAPGPTTGQTAPVLIVPRLLEPDFCRALIDYYRREGGRDSGFMRNAEDGSTIGLIDYGHKRRRDCQIRDESLRAGLRGCIERRLVPEIQKAFQFTVTVVERYIVACYDAGEGGFFRPHRDNTTKGTAHRRFAVTINLNAEDYEGGDLRFPEYDARLYRAPTGGAVVFSCSILHEAQKVTRGTRYCTLPFLYDEAGAKLRDENQKFLVEV
jgi:peroxiredoxin